MLEPCDGKLSRTVVRGLGAGNSPWLPGVTVMKTIFLVQKGRQGKEFFLNCTMLSDVVVAATEESCMELLKGKINEFLNSHGKDWVNKLKSTGTNGRKINCPDSFVRLPVDTWCCKHDDEICSLQASIDLSDKESFLSNCRADKKEGIFAAIEQKAYDGFHHVPGRYLCPYCDHTMKHSQQNFKYHYPWELYPLWECVKLDDVPIFKEMHRQNIPLSVRSSKVCASCFLKLLNLLSLGYANDFFILEVDFFPR